MPPPPRCEGHELSAVPGTQDVPVTAGSSPAMVGQGSEKDMRRL